MREIKFRAWDGEKLTYQNEDGWFDACYMGVNGSRQSCQLQAAKDNCEIEQHTGMINSDGKGIYEGDIIDWINYGPIIQRGVVVFKQGRFLMDRFLNDWNTGKYEIIGNIHENPELLK